MAFCDQVIMRKKVYGKQLGRSRTARRALFRSLIRSLVKNNRIKTTKAKARAVQPEIDRVIGIARAGGVSGRRRVNAILGNDRKTVQMIFDKVAPVFADRVSGYTRIIPLPPRKGDKAEVVRLEWSKEMASLEMRKGKDTTKKSKNKKTEKQDSKNQKSKKSRTSSKSRKGKK